MAGEPLVHETSTQRGGPAPVYSPTGSGDAPETDCDLPPRLYVGDQAQRTGGDPVNLRSAPARWGIDVGDVVRSRVVTVLEGPVRADNYSWYRVAKAEILLPGEVREGWVAESGGTDAGCAYFFQKVAPIETFESQTLVTFDLTSDERDIIVEDLPAFHTDAQLEAAKDAIIQVMVFSCDAATTLGGSIGVDATKRHLLPLLFDFLTELVKEGTLELKDYTADTVREDIQRGEPESVIPEVLDLLGEFLQHIPTGWCSLGYETYNIFAGEVFLDFLEATTRDEPACEIRSNDPVPAHSWPGPSGNIIGKVYAHGGLHPLGLVRLPGQPRFYMVSGALGSDWQIVGSGLTYFQQLFQDEATSGVVFLLDGYVTANKRCDNLPDLTDFVQIMDPSADGRDLADPNILLARHPGERECTIEVKGWYRLYDSAREASRSHESSTKDAIAVGAGLYGHYMRIYKFASYDDTRKTIYVKRIRHPGQVLGVPDDEGWLARAGITKIEYRGPDGSAIDSCSEGLARHWDTFRALGG